MRSTDPNRLGDIAEQWVALIAAWKGAEVFRNTGCTGKIDMILSINQVCYPIDVKLARQSQGSRHWHGNTYKVEHPIVPVLVVPDGDICDWKIKWIRNRYPEELEHFWDKPIH
jgi:hypothetical protein